MHTLRKYGPEIGLLALLVVFIALKIPDLPLPYFWDEIGVYAPGALRMHDADISLMPAALDPEYSRGHPLLAVAFYASWMRLFGDGVVAAHAASLALGCATLTAQYFGTRRLIGPGAALLGTVFTATQPIFWAMSGVVLPEMLLTLLTVVCFYGIARPHLLAYVVGGSLAVLTKESGLTIPAAACLYFALEGLVQRDMRTLRRWTRIAAGAAPLAVFGAFLLIQKEQNGWYFFPYHIGFIDLSPSRIWGATKHALHDIFFQQGRWLIGIAALAAAPLSWRQRMKEPAAARVVVSSALLIAGAVGFSVINFYLTRYLLYIIPMTCIAGGWAWATIASALPRKARTVALTVIGAGAISLGYANMSNHGFQDTADMSYTQVVRNKQEALNWAQAQPWRDSVVSANFPVFQALQDSRFGYVARPWRYSENGQQPTTYAIIWNGDATPPEWMLPRPYDVIKRFDKDFSHIFIVRFR